MKSITLTACFLLSTFFINAQQDFEGMIRYKASPEKDLSRENSNPDSLEITILFSRGKIRIVNTMNSEKDDILVLIDSAKSYTLDKKRKTFGVKRLRENRPPETLLPLTIAGYACSPVRINAWMPFGGADVSLWFADSLFFQIPEKYEGNDELLMIRKGHIMLKAVIRENNYSRRYMDSDTVTADPGDHTFILIATEILPGAVKPEDFLIPPGFTKAGYPYYPVDTAASYPDSVVAISDTLIPKPAPVKKLVPAKKIPIPEKKPAETKVKSGGGALRKEN
ncbi:MAG: hypothetical protein HZA79_05655 [Sphingobacteriales bacterium]|nr:hypothetical protein [Sphingobacteriales bacterium]